MAKKATSDIVFGRLSLHLLLRPFHKLPDRLNDEMFKIGKLLSCVWHTNNFSLHWFVVCGYARIFEYFRPLVISCDGIWSADVIKPIRDVTAWEKNAWGKIEEFKMIFVFYFSFVELIQEYLSRGLWPESYFQ